ncbi:MAG: acylphosphatase [Alphaproteobacteria bacterium]
MQVHIRITGRVQGVGYRAWTVQTAERLGLIGFVRNRRDKSVEVWAEGTPRAVQTLLEQCRQGPVFARVDDIEPYTHPDAPMPKIGQAFVCERTL